MDKITFLDKIPSSLSSSGFLGGNAKGSSSDGTTAGVTVAGTASQSEQVVLGPAQETTAAVQQTQKAATKASDLDKKALKEALSTLQTDNTSLNFSIDDTLGTVVIKVVDKTSGDVVRQIPAEEVLLMRQQQVDKSRGVLFDKVM